MEEILESFAEYYSLNLAKETMKVLRENAYNCRFNGGYVPFSYSVDPETKKYLINADEALYVQLIFKMYNNGSKYPDIIKALKKFNIKTRFGKDFTYSGIHEMLCNEKYAGVYTFNKRLPRGIDGKRNNHSTKNNDEIIKIQNGVPQIVDTETFLTTQKLLDAKKRATRKTKEIYLLSGLIICGECGKPYCGNRKHNGFGKIYAMYRCNGGCGNTEIHKSVIEEMVFQKLIENIFSKYALSHLSKDLTNIYKAKGNQKTNNYNF